MHLPEELLKSLEQSEGFDRQAFEAVHNSGEQITSIRLNPAKPVREFRNFFISQSQKVPWAEYGFYLEKRPSFTFDPLFHAGCYYVQEASSMFLEQALKQTADLSRCLCVLDLAAAPGGKSTHLHSLISEDSLLVSNDVIQNRSKVLRDNIIKWGCGNVAVTNNDPRDFTELKNFFDVILVDAPCSGSGLFRRDEEAIGEWSENNVQLCSQRQQRILADVWPALKANGTIVYSTCSYSPAENEEIVAWMKKVFSAETRDLAVDGKEPIVATGGGYRFWPDKVKGEGFFIAALKKREGRPAAKAVSNKKLLRLNRNELARVKPWLRETDHEFVKIENVVYAIPAGIVDELDFLLNRLQVVYFGTMVGELMRNKFVPSHGLAMSHLVSPGAERVELDYEQAIQYLQKKEMVKTGLQPGWKLVTYDAMALGWINVLTNRINNYYPKELRILKDI